MYVRLLRFSLESGQRPRAEAFATRFMPIIRAQKGCHTCKFIIDEENDEYGIVVLWDTKEDAVAAGGAIIGPRLRPVLAKIAKEPPAVGLFEVYEPQGLGRIAFGGVMRTSDVR